MKEGENIDLILIFKHFQTFNIKNQNLASYILSNRYSMTRRRALKQIKIDLTIL